MISGAPKVFISYRREETAGHAGRLYDVMSNRFGESNVFMDVDIAPGVDFVHRITEAVGGCHVLLVIVGPHWATISNGSSLPRIFKPDDFVRLEVETGIRRSNVTVIPVLVGGAKMPDPTALPAPLRDLTRRNALELSDTRWRYDVDRLMGTLDGLLADTSAVHKVVAPVTPPVGTPALGPTADRPYAAPVTEESAPPRPPWGLGRMSLVVTTTLVAALAGVVGNHLGGRLHKTVDDGSGFDKASRIFNDVAPAGVAWAVVGASVAIWLAWRLPTRRLSLGWLALGWLIGAIAGAGGAAAVSVPRWLWKNHNMPDDTRRYLTIVGFGLAGAVIGALVGWIWNRRGSAGFAVGLLVGAVYEAAAYTGENDRFDLRTKAALVAALVVGFTAGTQALLDAWTTRSPRVVASSRGP